MDEGELVDIDLTRKDLAAKIADNRELREAYEQGRKDEIHGQVCELREAESEIGRLKTQVEWYKKDIALRRWYSLRTEEERKTIDEWVDYCARSEGW